MRADALAPPPVVRSTEPGARERGCALGAGERDEILACWAGYERLFSEHPRDFAEATLERIDNWAPRLAAEIEGIAAGAGLETWQVAALNARTEILARGRGECSTFVCLPRTIQTWDWHEHLDDVTFVWELEPRPGHTVRTFTEYGIVGKIGINGAGLGLHLNILHHASDGEGVGVPIHVVARRILDEASSVDEAAEIARSADVCASTVMTAVDRTSAACLELCPDGLAEIRPEDGVLLHTNHFLDPRLAQGEDTHEEDPGSWDRLERLQQRVGELRAARDHVELAEAMLHHDAPICCHPEDGAPFGDRYATLAMISFDLDARLMHVRAGGPCAAGAEWITV
jgi:isopenicillin-N N-acyltransferase-like protein